MPPTKAQEQQLEKKMKEVFKTLDQNKDNKVSKAELKNLISALFQMPPDKVPAELVDVVMTEADKDKSGYISEGELKHAFACLQGLAIVFALHEEFQKMDKDKNGYLTKDELAALFKGQGQEGEVADQLMKAMDVDQNGKVTFEEFVQVACQVLVVKPK